MDNQILLNILCLHGVQQRYTRAKTIGANYTEEKTKNRIRNKDKEIGNIIDIKKSEKQGQAKATSSGQQDTILKLQLLRLLKSGIKDLIQLKNWSKVLWVLQTII